MQTDLDSELRRAMAEALRRSSLQLSAEAAEKLDRLIRTAIERNEAGGDRAETTERMISKFGALVHAMAIVATADEHDAMPGDAVDRILIRASPLFPFC